MIAVGIVGLLIFISFSMVFTLAICKAAAMADEQTERLRAAGYTSGNHLPEPMRIDGQSSNAMKEKTTPHLSQSGISS
jgi:hypothetical protein